MSTNLYDFFTDVEVLKSREPEYFKCAKAVNIGYDSDEELLRLPCNADATREVKEGNMQAPPAIVKTFVSILDEGCKKYYDGASPRYSSIISPEKNDLFVIQCELRDLVGSGRAKTKKAAKQLAAKEILLQIAEKGNHSEFGLGKSKAAAVNFLNSLMPEISAQEEETEGSASENWIGKINEKCQRLKLRAAIYEVEDRGTPTQHLFVATCSVYQLVATGQGRTKKAAKMQAAQQMYKLLEENNELIRQGKDELEAAVEENMRADEAVTISEKETLDSVSASSPAEQPQPVISPTEVEKESDSSAVAMVHEALLAAEVNSKGLQAKLQMVVNAGESSIENIFAKQQLSFTILEQPDINGCVQCMLKVVGPNGEANVFGGTGQTEEASKDCAARAAFVYLETFLDAAMKSQQQ